MNRKNFTTKKLSRKKFATFLLATSILIFSPTKIFAADEETIEIPEQMLIISAEKWNDREINLLGSGTKNILIYSTTQGGSFNNATVDSTKTPLSIFAGYFDGDAEENEIVDVTGNKIVVDDYGEGWLLFETGSFSEDNNRLHLFDRNDNDLKINLIGARSGYGAASGNILNIFGGKLNGYVIAAENKSDAENFSQNISDNTVNVYNSPDLREIKLYGAAIFDENLRERTAVFGTNNTLNFYTKKIEVEELNGFNNYNFYLPETIINSEIVLNVLGDEITDVSGTKIFASVPQVSTIDPHENIILLQNNSAGIEDNLQTSYKVANSFDGSTKWQRNPSAIYDLHIGKINAKQIAVSFTGNSLTPPTEFIPLMRSADYLVGGGDFFSSFDIDGDFATGEGNFAGNFRSATGGGDFENNSDGRKNFEIGRNFESDAGSQSYIPFFAMTHGSTHQKANSKFNTRSTNFIAGFSRKIENDKRKIFIAPLIEYGRGNFTSQLSGGEIGQGHLQNFGIGFVFRNQMSDGKFFEGSFRGGRIKTDFETNDFGFNGLKVYEKFKSNSPYFGLHFGLGRTIQHDKKNVFSYYGKFLYTHTKSDNTSITSGEEFYLSHVNSARIKLGIRDSYAFSEKNKIYFGLAWQYDFGGANYAEHDSLRMYSAGLRGSSGVFEFGWTIKPNADDRLSFDLSGAGTFGKRRGLVGRFGLNWNF